MPDDGGCQLPEGRSKEECAKNLGGGTGAATIGNWERFLVFLEFYFQLLLCGCDEGQEIRSPLRQMRSSQSHD